MTLGAALRYVMQTAWALEETVLGQLAEIVMRHNEGGKLSAEEIQKRIQAASPGGPKQSDGYSAEGGVAIVPIYGVISKYSAGIDDISQPEGCSVEQIRDDYRAALADKSVHTILLDIESPGGTIDGIAELADELAACTKTLVAFANGQMCSAAFWLGSQGDEIVGSKSSMVGSIGCYTVSLDSSRAAENAGYKVNVVRAGAMKGAGTRGAPVAPEHLAELQRTIDAYYSMFIEAVATGRGISTDEARALGDGRVHIGQTAKAQGLVDRIDTFENTLARLQASVPQPPTRGGTQKGARTMAKTEAEIRAEIEKNHNDIKAAFPSDAAYALECITSGKSLIEAQAAYSTVLQKRMAEQASAHAEALKAKDEEIAKLKAATPKTEEKPAPAPGNAGVQTDHTKSAAKSGDGSAKATFEALFQENLKALGGNRSKAMSKTVADNPDVHAQVLEDQALPKAAKSKK